MSTISAEERAALRDSVHRLLADKSTETDVRRTMETEAGYDAALWKQLADLGIAGLVIDEDFGGAGAGPLELEAVMEEAGAALLCAPLLGSSVLTAELLRALGDREANMRLLPRIADGGVIAAAALTGDGGSWTADGVTVSADAQNRLSGLASYVIHGRNADVLIVVANGPDGLAAYDVDPKAAGVAIAPLPTFDHTLRLARVVFDNAKAIPLQPSRPVWEAVEQALALALVGLAGEQAGGARRVLDFTVDYAKTRIQFGRAIGSFQAIKHMAADLLLESESAISAARNAAQKLADGGGDAGEAVSLAAFACADAFSLATANAVQMHGGIAFTWAHPAHLYLRRARADAQLFGASAWHRERYLEALGA